MSRIEMGRLSNGREMHFWDASAAGYDKRLDKRGWRVPSLVDGFLEKLGSDPKRVLDLATGTGKTLNAIFTHTQPERVVGVDSSVQMLRYAQKRYREESRLTLIHASVDEYLKNATNGFDLITYTEAMHFSQQPEVIINGIANLLNPGGLFVFTHDLIVKPELEAQSKFLHKTTGREITVYRQHSLDITDMLNQSGLKPVSDFVFSPFPYTWKNFHTWQNRKTRNVVGHMVAAKKPG